MRVLVACEESQEVCKAFREKGHYAFSCDIQDCSGGHPEWHINGDCLKVLSGNCEFWTEDGKHHYFPYQWDLIIAHPPCTFLTAAGAVRLFNKDHQIKDIERYKKGLQARNFFFTILNCNCERIAIENPVPMKIFDLPQYNQIIQPYYFGDPWLKRTCLWLKGLDTLKSTEVVKPVGYWFGAHGHNKAKNGMIKGFRDSKTRSKTFPGIAKAMAEQWGVYDGK